MAKPPDAADGTMSLPACARYLHLGEKTVLKLATEGKLPGVMIDGHWRFQRHEIDRWLQQQLLGEDQDFEEVRDGARVPLGDILPDDGVIGDLEAREALGVIEELAARAYSNGWLNDKPWFIGAVVEREALASTAMEGGVAFLHTRARDTSKIARPFVIVGRSYDGVDFGSPDGKPTYLFFMLGLKYDKLHLPILGRLARAMRDPRTIAKLRAQPSPQKMRALLLKEDAAVLSQTKKFPVKYEQAEPTLDRQMRLRTIMRLNAQRKHEAKKAAEAMRKSDARKAAAEQRKSPRAKPARTAGAPGKAGRGASKVGAKAAAGVDRARATPAKKTGAKESRANAPSKSKDSDTDRASSGAGKSVGRARSRTGEQAPGRGSVSEGKNGPSRPSARTGKTAAPTSSNAKATPKRSAAAPAAKKAAAKKTATKKSTTKKSATKQSTAKKSG